MRSLRRTSLSVALTIGCLFEACGSATAAQNKAAARPVHRDPRMQAAQVEETRGNLAEAKRIYTTVYHSTPSNAECCHRLALVYAKLNQHAEAEVYYRKADTINPNNPQLLADRGYSASQRKDFVQAEEFLDRSTKLDPSNRNAIRTLGIVRAWLNKDEASLTAFRLINDESDALRNLAAIQIARGDKGLGLQNYELAKNIKLKPAFADEIAQLPAPQHFSSVTEQIPILLPEPVPVVPMSSPGRVVSSTIPDAAPIPPAPITLPVAPTEQVILLPAPVEDKKLDAVTTCARPAASTTAYPMPVAVYAVTAVNQDMVEATVEVTPKPLQDASLASAPPAMATQPSELQPSEELVFELPRKMATTDTAANSLDEGARIGSEEESKSNTKTPHPTSPRKAGARSKTSTITDGALAVPPESDVAESDLADSAPGLPMETPDENESVSTDSPAATHKPHPLQIVDEEPTLAEKASVATKPAEKVPSEKLAAQKTPADPASAAAAPSISEICLVKLREDREIAKGSPEIVMEYHGQKYLCGTAEALQRFKADPERYIPSAGGLDFVLFRNQREFVQGSLNFATWYRQRLYLFSNQENKDEFEQNPRKYVTGE